MVISHDGNGNHILKVAIEEEEKRLATYLENTTITSVLKTSTTAHDDSGGVDDDADTEAYPLRTECCNSSRSLYCPECCKVLISKTKWPKCIQNQTLMLPFSMDIILGGKERRTSSSGIQVMAIRTMMMSDNNNETTRSTSNTSSSNMVTQEQHRTKSQESQNGGTVVDNNNDSDGDAAGGGGGDSCWWECTRLYDLNRKDMIPTYSDLESTYVLFPQKGKSVPVSTVARKIKKLIVLDIKWTRSAGFTRVNPTLSPLTCVHLEYPPQHSHFWRWHRSGDGMLSTVEAIYFAAMEVYLSRKLLDQGSLSNSNEEQAQRDEMINIMWLFALQRSIIQQRGCANDGDSTATQGYKPPPFSKEGKDFQIALRVRKDARDQDAKEKQSNRDPLYKSF
jgi:hypothetical protein